MDVTGAGEPYRYIPLNESFRERRGGAVIAPQGVDLRNMCLGSLERLIGGMDP